MKNITILSPEITQILDKNLLSKPTIKFYDDCERIWKIFQYIERKLKKKCKNHPEMLQKYLKLQQEFMELYERAKTKEDEYEKKKGKPFGQPFHYFKYTDKRYKEIYSGLRFKK